MCHALVRQGGGQVDNSNKWQVLSFIACVNKRIIVDFVADIDYSTIDDQVLSE